MVGRLGNEPSPILVVCVCVCVCVGRKWIIEVHKRFFRVIHQFFPLLYIQLWARAYHDQTYHAAINTTNGVESQNRLLKYSYLPRRKHIISHLATVLYEEFVPGTHHKYLYLNYQMSETYRRYNNFVRDYLRECPR